ncbi:hypothetical protein [Lacticaseibacillus nasuensis]|uniref:hypothetical protein n=1 Tax=Lacticaseibacillus nasuensis TaxID=944671 RepID=UPI002245E3B2|nr:hypothetical protein [Lacticaseibacillus nasuensis]MCX2455656.1 hypothetical protein [Lacticaseibacillus nasuensis]
MDGRYINVTLDDDGEISIKATDATGDMLLATIASLVEVLADSDNCTPDEVLAAAMLHRQLYPLDESVSIVSSPIGDTPHADHGADTEVK